MQNEIMRRRKLLSAQMRPSSAAFFFAAPEVIRSKDTHYPYRQDSDFWYLTGFNEAEAIFVVIKHDDSTITTELFNRKKDPTAEIWTGFRLGQAAAPKQLNIDKAYNIVDAIKQLSLDLKNIATLYHAPGRYSFADALVEQLNTRMTFQLADWQPIVHEMRLFKSLYELDRIGKAGEISAKAHIAAMKRTKPGLSESDLEAEILYTFAQHKAKNPSYNPIVGSGSNACTLHYERNNDTLHDGDLVLIDAGCEYEYYAGDVTRTFPINGKFTPAQHAVYDIVLEAQKLALRLLKPGISIKRVNDEVIRLKLKRLKKLGIVKGELDYLITEQAQRPFYMHGLGHWLGLDVHDVGDYGSQNKERLLEKDMVLTVEPGLYIQPNADVPIIYRGIGVRIEDNIVITATGNRLLTDLVPKEPAEIEALMCT